MTRAYGFGLVLAVLAGAPALPAGGAQADDSPRVLFLSKSAGFEHSVIARKDGPSHVERVLQEVADKHGFELELSKDASLIRAQDLERFDAVVFFTTGDLTQEGRGEGLFGGDQNPPMAATGVEDLRQWVEAGGAFLGFHSATDTFHGPDDSDSPYIRLLGGEFLTHGRQFEGRLRVVDPGHPAVSHIPAGWTVLDEWYVFKNLDRDSMHVLALLETASEPYGQSTYDRSDYPVIWCKSVGSGRVFYNAMGHREDVWDREIFQQAFVDALNWALGKTQLRAEPNFAEVTPAGDE